MAAEPPTAEDTAVPFMMLRAPEDPEHPIGPVLFDDWRAYPPTRDMRSNALVHACRSIVNNRPNYVFQAVRLPFYSQFDPLYDDPAEAGKWAKIIPEKPFGMNVEAYPQLSAEDVLLERVAAIEEESLPLFMHHFQKVKRAQQVLKSENTYPDGGPRAAIATANCCLYYAILAVDFSWNGRGRRRHWQGYAGLTKGTVLERWEQHLRAAQRTARSFEAGRNFGTGLPDAKSLDVENELARIIMECDNNEEAVHERIFIFFVANFYSIAPDGTTTTANLEVMESILIEKSRLRETDIGLNVKLH